MLCKGYVINLASSHERMASARTAITAHGMEVVRIEGFDGSAINVSNFESYDDRKAQKFMGRSMTAGEIGCFIGHQRAVKAFLESEEPVGIVFEDDLEFSQEAIEAFPALLQWLSARDDWECVNIGATQTTIFSHIEQVAGTDVVHAHYFPMLAHALIYDRKGAQTFLNASQPIYCPADNFVRTIFTANGRGFATIPRLVLAGDLGSDIDFRSDGNRQKFRRTWLYGLRKQRRLWGQKLTAYRNKYF